MDLCPCRGVSQEFFSYVKINHGGMLDGGATAVEMHSSWEVLI
jgi:hypothetical protein